MPLVKVVIIDTGAGWLIFPVVVETIADNGETIRNLYGWDVLLSPAG
jgi:hypothetical protein